MIVPKSFGGLTKFHDFVLKFHTSPPATHKILWVLLVVIPANRQGFCHFPAGLACQFLLAPFGPFTKFRES